jgi:nitrite reductase/ring-hydroxylating ferredoxin subunit
MQEKKFKKVDFVEAEIAVGQFNKLDNPGCREFKIGEGDWPFKGFIVRQGETVFAYQNYCMHVGHPLNWEPDSFLTRDGANIICSSHGAVYDIPTGECIAGPCIGKKLRSLPAEVRDGVVFVRGPTTI